MLKIRSLTCFLSGLDDLKIDLSRTILSRLDEAFRILTLILNDEDDGRGFAHSTFLTC